MAYDYFFLSGTNNSYVFETSVGIVYEIKFKPTTYLFDESYIFSKLVYEFIIDVAVNETSKKPTI